MAATDNPYFVEAVNAANNAGVPPAIYTALIQQESGGGLARGIDPSSWNAHAVGTSGEYGLAQLMPNTASDLGVNPYDWKQNLQGGANYLAGLFKHFGNWTDALRAYNAGPTGATNNPTLSSGYASTILAAAGTQITAQPVSGSQTTGQVLDMSGGAPGVLRDANAVPVSPATSGAQVNSTGDLNTLWNNIMAGLGLGNPAAASQTTVGNAMGVTPTGGAGSPFGINWLAWFQQWGLYIVAALVALAFLWFGVGSLFGKQKIEVVSK